MRLGANNMESRDGKGNKIPELIVTPPSPLDAPGHVKAPIEGTPENAHAVSMPDRDVYTKTSFDKVSGYEPPPRIRLVSGAGDVLKSSCGQCGHCGVHCIWRFIKARIPILGWIFKYNPKTDLFPDIVAGITVGIMQIPQAMAYAMLAGVPAVVGMYTSFFPVLIYCLMGTSRHVSVGTFAVVCLMVGRIVGKYSAGNDVTTTTDPPLNFTTSSLPYTEDMLHSEAVALLPTALSVAVAVTFCIGIFQVVFGILGFGSLGVYMSDILISGYTTASAVHVFTSQVSSLLGVTVANHSGPLGLFYIYIDMFSTITSKANVAAMIVSVIAVILLLIANLFLTPLCQKKLKIPFPMELLVIIGGTVASKYIGLHDDYKLSIVGEIPTGIPPPQVPDFHVVQNVVIDSVATSVVAFSIALSMAKVFAKKNQYEIDANQELIAHGSSNIFGSFFSCVTSSVSLSRSLIMESTAKSQIAALVASGLLLVVLLWLAPLLECLPKCVLAAIICVALKGMFKQFNDLIQAWKLSRIDAAIWLVAFIGTVLLDVDIGLAVGIGFSLLVVLVRAHRPAIRILGRVGDTDIYEDIEIYKGAQEFHGIKIFQFAGSLYYANRELFRKEMYKLVFNPKTLLHQREKQARKEKHNNKQDSYIRYGVDAETMNTSEAPIVPHEDLNRSTSLPTISDVMSSSSNNLSEISHVILDCTCWSFIDGSALSTLTQLVGEYTSVNCKVLFAGCRDNVLQVLERSTLYVSIKADIFPTLHDAVVHCCLERGVEIRKESNLPKEKTEYQETDKDYKYRGYIEHI